MTLIETIARALWDEAGCPGTYDTGHESGKAKFRQLAQASATAFINYRDGEALTDQLVAAVLRCPHGVREAAYCHSCTPYERPHPELKKGPGYPL